MQIKMTLLMIAALLANAFLIVDAKDGAQKPMISVKKIESDTYLFSATLRTGKALEGIRFQKQGMAGSWILHLQTSEGMAMRSADGQLLESALMTSDEFVEAIDGVLGALRREKMVLDYISVDLGLIDGYASLVGPAIRHSKCGGGVVKTADACWSRALRTEMSNAQITTRVCGVFVKHGGRCPRWPIGFDAIMLLPQMNGQPRSQVASSKNSGINIPAMSFEIAMIRTVGP